MDVKARAREHLEKHRDIYIGIGIGAALVGITWVIVKDPKFVLPRGADTALPRGAVSFDQTKTGTFVFANKSKISMGDITTNIHTGRQGHPGFITRCVETGEFFPTQGAAARFAGVYDSVMSGHLNGKLDSVNGLHFERITP